MEILIVNIKVTEIKGKIRDRLIIINYDSIIGRFINEDPLGFAGGDSNLFRYVQNDPVNFVDPLGLMGSGNSKNPKDIVSDAYRDSIEEFPESLVNGPRDAYRHCLASCNMTVLHGETTAALYGLANEKAGDWFHNQPKEDRKMDDFNNAAGCGFGKSAKNPADCAEKCKEAVDNGDLFMIDGYDKNASRYWD